MTYSNLLDENLHNDDADTNIYDDILNKKYDIVIYGSYHRGMPFYELVNKIYNPNEIILLCGEDTHCAFTGNFVHYCDYKKGSDKGHNVFVREL